MEPSSRSVILVIREQQQSASPRSDDGEPLPEPVIELVAACAHPVDAGACHRVTPLDRNPTSPSSLVQQTQRNVLEGRCPLHGSRRIDGVARVRWRRPTTSRW